MTAHFTDQGFLPLAIAILTVSDSRGEDQDSSGHLLRDRAQAAGHLVLDEIGTSTVQSRAFAGLANGTFIFCLPGSTGACRTAWDRILLPQLDRRTRPCNFAQLIPRLLEH